MGNDVLFICWVRGEYQVSFAGMVACAITSRLININYVQLGWGCDIQSPHTKQNYQKTNNAKPIHL